MNTKKSDTLPEVTYVSNHHILRANILFTASWVKNLLSELLYQNAGLTLPAARILLALANRGGKPASTNDLYEKMLDIGSDVPKLVSRMVAKGLLKKETSKTDKRLVNVTLTKEGQMMIKKVMDMSPTIDSVTGALTDSEVETLNKLLSKIRHIENENIKTSEFTL